MPTCAVQGVKAYTYAAGLLIFTLSSAQNFNYDVLKYSFSARITDASFEMCLSLLVARLEFLIYASCSRRPSTLCLLTCRDLSNDQY